jgi:putative addiction module component (TIGR02574 family)
MVRRNLWYNRQHVNGANKTSLSITDRIRLVEEIWDSIAEENEAFELTDGQKRELDRRLESSDRSQGRTWDEIKAEFMKSR